MHVLLRANRKIQGLKRKRLPAIQLAEQFEHSFVRCNGTDIVIIFPRILYAALSCGLVAMWVVKIDTIARRKIALYPIDPCIEIAIRKVKNRETTLVQIRCDPLLFHGQPQRGFLHREKWRFDQRKAGKQVCHQALPASSFA